MWIDEFEAVAEYVPLGLLLLGAGGELTAANSLALEYLGLDERILGRPGFRDTLESAPLREMISAPANGPALLETRVGNRVLLADLRPMPDGLRILSLRDVTALAGVSQIRRNFVTEVLHRLRTRLTTVLSVLALASGNRTGSRQVTPEVLGMAHQEAERLTAFVGRLRDLFLVETGTIHDEADVQPILLSEVLSRVVGGFRPRFDAKHQLIAEDYPQPEHRVLADAELLSRAFVHVVRNAHVHTPEGSWVRVDVRTTPREAFIRVTDNGPGVPADELPHVFDCFRRRDGEYGGEGLGLYIARQLLLAQNGSIHLDARPGGGTVVEITLPGAEPAP